jgi:hypothetical protein
MDGLPKLRLVLHCDVRTRRIDGVRAFDGGELVGEIELGEVVEAARLIDEDRGKAMEKVLVEARHEGT